MKYTLYADRNSKAPNRYHLRMGEWLPSTPERLILRHGVFTSKELEKVLCIPSVPIYFGFQHSVFYVNERVSFRREKVYDLPHTAIEWSVTLK